MASRGTEKQLEIALNEWPLLGARITGLNVRVWAEAEWPLSDRDRRQLPFVHAVVLQSPTHVAAQ